jgi:hypothetical protein
MIQIGQQTFSKKEFTKLLREGAVKSASLREFEDFLNNTNPLLTSNLSNPEIQILYQKFRQGSLNKYIDDLANSW